MNSILMFSLLLLVSVGAIGDCETCQVTLKWTDSVLGNVYLIDLLQGAISWLCTLLIADYYNPDICPGLIHNMANPFVHAATASILNPDFLCSPLILNSCPSPTYRKLSFSSYERSLLAEEYPKNFLNKEY